MPNIDQIIFDYRLNKDENIAFRLAFFYFSYLRKVLPKYNHTKLNLNKDPRDNIVFKYCYKMYNEVKDIINPLDLKLFIIAQIQMMKDLFENKGIPVLIDPCCLVGEKALIRWKIWKRAYDNRILLKDAKESGINIHSYDRVTKDILKTKKFLEAKIGSITREKINDLVKSRSIYRWFALNLVSGYFIILLDLNKELVDLSLYEDGITNDVKEFFISNFRPLS